MFWYHAVLVYSGTYAELYLNGILAGEDYDPASPGASDTNVDNNPRIGSHPTGTYDFNGLIDDVRLYDYALTEDEIQSLAQEPIGCNTPPSCNAGENVAIATEEQSVTTILATVTDEDDDPLYYRWLEGESVLMDWAEVGEYGEANLNLAPLPYFPVGEHTMTLVADDGQAVCSDDMILTVSNSAPHPAPSGSGTYEICTPITLGGDVSDFDGDQLTYEWLNGEFVLFSGQVQPPYGGDPVNLPGHDITGCSLGVGAHVLTLKVSDGVNDPVSADIQIDIVDTTVPTLAPVPNKTILWPPNHRMVNITIMANADDNSGSVTLAAEISSNEPEEGLGDGDTTPDWTEPVINQGTGEISFQLRSERSGSGDGRVYSIYITATDSVGNWSSALVEIIVPHDKRKK